MSASDSTTFALAESLKKTQKSIQTLYFKKGANNMTVTYQDELGVIAISIDKEYGVTFGVNKVFFTDEDGNDYKVNIEHLISISAE